MPQLRNYLALVLVFAAFFLIRPQSAHALSSEFGVVGAVPSFASDSAKQTAVDKIAELGAGWMRHEFRIDMPIDFTPYDAANNKAKAKGIKTLGLLLFTGSDRGHDGWKAYVQSVVSHYGSDITAWEIMNEPDNYLSGADYTAYLKEARDIIRSINPSATIVLGGITSRVETPNFWNAVAAAGGWDAFDVAGLHVYHSGNPEKVNFGGGDLLAEYDRAVTALKKNGGGKKIWITETGYTAAGNGNDNQANWLARTLIMSRAVPSIEKIFVYRLADDSQATYGLMGADFSNRPAFDRIKEVISQLNGKGIGSRLYPQDKKILDTLDSASGWKADATTNGSLGLGSVAGKVGNALEMKYSFNADQAYTVAQKPIPVEGTPQALAAWIYGDDTKNVWKYRFKDAKGETFQDDLGTIGAEWIYKQFTIGSDTAYVSWDGDGKIDYPISFNSFVIDRQSSDASGVGKVDELTAIYGGADLFAFQFGDFISYWKVSGTGSGTLCGEKRDFAEAPRYAGGVNCSDTPKISAPAVTATPKTAAAKVTVDKAKSVVRIDGANVPADGQSTYRIVMLLKDANDNLIKNQKPVVKAQANPESLTISDPTLVGNEWWVTVASKAAGNRIVTLTVGSVQLADQTLVYGATATPEPTPSPSPSPSVAPAPIEEKSQLPLVLGVSASSILAVGGLFALWWFRIRRKNLDNNQSHTPS
jgi:hypothetical protein